MEDLELINTIEDHYLTGEQCFFLKELGFVSDCITTVSSSDQNKIFIWHEEAQPYSNEYLTMYAAVPTYDQAFKFFRDNFQLHGLVFPIKHEDKTYYTNNIDKKLNINYPTFEEARSKCIDKLIIIAKRNKEEDIM
jgi:hypothetical protein